MYRTLLATCGSENFRGLYSIKLRIFGFHFRGATRCKQRAVHCLSMKIYLSSYHFGVLLGWLLIASQRVDLQCLF